MAVRISCPNCGKRGHTREDRLAKYVRCPDCGNQFRIAVAPGAVAPGTAPVEATRRANSSIDVPDGQSSPKPWIWIGAGACTFVFLSGIALAVLLNDPPQASTGRQPNPEDPARSPVGAAERPALKKGQSHTAASPPVHEPNYPVGELLRVDSGSESVTCVAFSPDGRFGFSAGKDSLIRQWDLETGGEVRRFPGNNTRILCLAVSPDGEFIASGGGDPSDHNVESTLRVWRIETGEPVFVKGDHERPITAVAFTPGGRHVMTASADNTARMWELPTGRQYRRFDEHEMAIDGAALSPDGRLAVTATGGSVGEFTPGGGLRLSRTGITFYVWDVQSSSLQKTFSGDDHIKTEAVRFLPDGERVLSCGQDGTLRLWSVNSGDEIQKIDAEKLTTGGERNFRLYCADVSPDGRFALTGGGTDSWDDDGPPPEHYVQLWDLQKGTEVYRFRGHEGGVGSVAFSPGGKRALSGDWKGTIRLWGLPQVSRKD